MEKHGANEDCEQVCEDSWRRTATTTEERKTETFQFKDSFRKTCCWQMKRGNSGRREHVGSRDEKEEEGGKMLEEGADRGALKLCSSWNDASVSVNSVGSPLKKILTNHNIFGREGKTNFKRYASTMSVLFVAALFLRMWLAVSIGNGFGSAPGQDPCAWALHHWRHDCSKKEKKKKIFRGMKIQFSHPVHQMAQKQDETISTHPLYRLFRWEHLQGFPHFTRCISDTIIQVGL